ncbi:MAG TPA: class I SAM-dependent methyltransferase [Candidatus Binatus sp.]|nr:class I SAM-dependent methyltransferase [Candidatus Binatus sp.]
MKFKFDENRVRTIRQRWSKVIDSMYGPATKIMLESAGLAAGMRVLDVAAGAGDQTIHAADRVGPNGYVLATDIMEEALLFAASDASKRGIRNVGFHAMPCEALAATDASFDAAICRNGLQYLSDQPKGFAEIYRVLKPNGKLAAIVWSAPRRNPFLARSFDLAFEKLGTRPPSPDEPGPFRLGYDGALRSALEASGFAQVRVDAVKAPVSFSSASEALQFQQQALGLLTQLLEGLSESDRAHVWRQIEQALRAFERDGSFAADGELLVGSGVKLRAT